MAFNISQLPSEEASYARQALTNSNFVNGNGAMNPVNTGMFNANDGSGYTKFGNPQEDIVRQQRQTDIQQNAISSASQRSAAAIQGVDMEITQQSDAEFKAQIGLNTQLANIMEVLPSKGAATKEFGNPQLIGQRMEDVNVTRLMNAKRLA
tara:strand:+ start:3092 stop:3544 length:453 start_codon:yes stop_codon:yes gene_type:complete